MTTPFLNLTPSQANYSFGLTGDAISVKLDGGRSRTRALGLNNTRLVNVGWLVDSLKYDYLMAFYRTLKNGVLAFQVNMIIDNSTLQLYTAWFVPDTLQLTNVEAENYTLQAQFEVLPLDSDPDFDASFVTLYGLYGSQTQWFLDAIEYVANVALPGTSS